MIRGNTVLTLLVLVLLLVAANLAIDISTGEAPTVVRRLSLIPAAEKAVEFSLARSSAGTNATIVLANDQGWVIKKPVRAKADEHLIRHLADAIAFAPIMEEMGDAELLRLGRVRADFGLDSPAVTVQMKDFDGSTTRLDLGSFTPSGDGVYAVVDGLNSVFIAPSNLYAIATSPVAEFRYRKVFDVARDDVTVIDIKRGKGDFLRFTREDKIWKMSVPREAIASSSRIDKFFDSIESATAVDFVGPTSDTTNATPSVAVSVLAGYGLDPESAVSVSLKRNNGSDVVALLGRESSPGFVYVLLPDGQTIATLSNEILNLAINGMKTLMDTCIFPMDAKAVKALSFEDGGVQYLLSKGTKESDPWRMESPLAVVADEKNVAKMVDRIVALKFSDLDADGVRVSVGTNSEPMVVSRQALFADLNPTDLCGREVLRIPASDIRRIAIDGKDVTDPEVLAKLAAVFDPLKASKMVRLKVTDADLGSFGLDNPQRVISIDRNEQEAMRRNLMIGDVTDGGRYATLGANGAVFVLPVEVVTVLMEEAVQKP